jgi:hypothetical protein
MKIRQSVTGLVALATLITSIAFAQTDPGVRRGPPGAGAPLPGLTPIELQIFNEGVQRFIQLEAVCDSCMDGVLGQFTDPAQANLVTITNSAGLGARFNGDQCSVCHNQPALGGSGGFMVPNPQDSANRFRPPENPMFDLIPHRKGATNRPHSLVHPAIRADPRSALRAQAGRFAGRRRAPALHGGRPHGRGYAQLH